MGVDPLLISISAGILVSGAGIAFYLLIVRPRKIAEIEGSLETILFRVLLPQEEHPAPGESRHIEHKEILVAMEQFYAAFTSIHVSSWHRIRFGTPSFTFEAAVPHVGEEATFYMAVPRMYAAFALNQLNALFPSAKIIETKDYNIFHPTGVSMAAYIMQKKSQFLSLRTYQDLGKDPLEGIVAAFSKLKKEGEGAAIQVVVRPAQNPLYTKGKDIARKVRAGQSFGAALGGVGQDISKMIGPKVPVSTERQPEPPKAADEELARQIEEKSGRPAFDVNIRIIASAATPEETQTILHGLEAAFAQFNNPQGNEISFSSVAGRSLEDILYMFSFRLFDESRMIYVSSAELSSLFHFPYAGFSQPNVESLKAREAPPPPSLATEGLLLGKSVFRGQEKDIFMTPSDRQRHMYVIGQTGTGKSALLREMARQDIQAGNGVCFIDPHGQDIQTLMETIPKERLEDVIYFNPGDTERPIGINFLEYDTSKPEQKSRVVNELFEIFNKLFNMSVAGGPMFEQYFRNSTMLVLEDPASGNTLFEVERVLADKQFREYKLSRSANVVVNTFWKQVAEKAGGEASLANMVPYVTSKFDTFLADEIMRPIIAQEKSSFNFREVMDSGKILLINLSKGKLGELNSSLLGLIIVGKILMAALSREDVQDESARRNFYLYIDEFQNVTTKSIATILSEARKYHLNLIIAHQFLGQLEDDIKKAVFGNVGSIASFRIGSDDGEFMERQFAPTFNARDLLNIDNYNAYVKLLMHGQTSRAFNIKTLPPREGNPQMREAIIQYSRLKYGKPRAEIEAAIRERFSHS